jgi:hypothetical protein
MWRSSVLPALCASLMGACALATAFSDDMSADGRGWFTVKREGDGVFAGNLSGYVAHMDARGEAVSAEFWKRAAGFCRGEVERLTETLCTVHLLAGTPPGTELGQCANERFRCKAQS